MSFELARGIEILERTPATLDSLLMGLSDHWTTCNEGPETFSAFDVMGHLIHGERTDWIPRLRIILDHGPARPFDPFDRFAMYEESRGKRLTQLLETFRGLREENLRVLIGLRLSLSDLEKRGTHPELGSVTAGELLATWVTHDLGHISQIVRVMARQNASAVGPWKAYLGILKR